MDETTYYFDVHPDALDGALDRFSQFFISPLFDASCTEREIQAVDSENKKNLQSDMWRLFQLEKSLSSREHAYWRFGTGNLETLWTSPRAKGLDVRDELLKFHRQHYSANLMKLAVVGKRALFLVASEVKHHLIAAQRVWTSWRHWSSIVCRKQKTKTCHSNRGLLHPTLRKSSRCIRVARVALLCFSDVLTDSDSRQDGQGPPHSRNRLSDQGPGRPLCV